MIFMYAKLTICKILALFPNIQKTIHTNQLTKLEYFLEEFILSCWEFLLYIFNIFFQDYHKMNNPILEIYVSSNENKSKWAQIIHNLRCNSWIFIQWSIINIICKINKHHQIFKINSPPISYYHISKWYTIIEVENDVLNMPRLDISNNTLFRWWFRDVCAMNEKEILMLNNLADIFTLHVLMLNWRIKFKWREELSFFLPKWYCLFILFIYS